MIAAALIAASVLAPSSVGVGISGFPACLDTPAQPGHSYVLHVSVTDTGDSGESVSLRTDPPVNGLKGIPVPASWVSFGYPRLLWVLGQSSVSLSPGKSAEIPVTVNIPGDAKPGLYGANLVASSGGSRAPGGGGQAVLGAAAEDDLSFAVAPAAAPSCDPYNAVPSSATPPPAGPPTAGTGVSAPAPAPAGQYAPASPAASQGIARKVPTAVGWALLVAIVLIGLRVFGRKS